MESRLYINSLLLSVRHQGGVLVLQSLWPQVREVLQASHRQGGGQTTFRPLRLLIRPEQAAHPGPGQGGQVLARDSEDMH